MTNKNNNTRSLNITSATNRTADKLLNHPPTHTLRQNVAHAMQAYFEDLDGSDMTDLYNLVMNEMEAPLLESVMQYVQGNQSRASTLLGLNRGTLRKKLKHHNLL